MRKWKNNFNLFLFMGILLGVASCDSVDYFFSESTTSAFIRYSNTESDFLNGKGVASANYTQDGWFILPDKSLRTYFVDARNALGYSNWSNFTTKYPFNYEISDKSNISRYLYDDYFLGSIALSSPPAHLHLCLKTWDENPVGKIPGKTWLVESIKDGTGKSLADDPDWSNYTDNRMRFKKTDKFVLYLGKKRSSIEQDLFGTADSINGTFTVLGNATNSTLSVKFPGYEESFSIVESGWNSLTITGAVKGKTGTMTLSPEK